MKKFIFIEQQRKHSVNLPICYTPCDTSHWVPLLPIQNSHSTSVFYPGILSSLSSPSGWVCPGQPSLAHGRRKGHFFSSRHQGQGEHIGSCFTCHSGCHSISTKNIFLRRCWFCSFQSMCWKRGWWCAGHSHHWEHTLHLFLPVSSLIWTGKDSRKDNHWKTALARWRCSQFCITQQYT